MNKIIISIYSFLTNDQHNMPHLQDSGKKFLILPETFATKNFKTYLQLFKYFIRKVVIAR